jgi:hypothetical protein
MVYDNDGPIYSMLSGKVSQYTVTDISGFPWPSPAAGVYVNAGTFNNKPYYYKSSDGGWYLYFNATPPIGDGSWSINGSLENTSPQHYDGGCFYNGTDTPPSGDNCLSGFRITPS